MKIVSFICLCFLYLSSNLEAQNQWAMTNGPFGGTIIKLLCTKSKNTFACTDNGLYSSKDMGKSWEKKFDKGVNAIEEVKDGGLYLGCRLQKDDIPLIYYSSDKGNSWEPTKSQPECWEVSCLHIDEAGNIFVGTSNNGLFKSSDKGDSWIAVNSGLQDNSITNIKSNNKMIVLGTSSGGIYLSKNNGIDWIPIYSGLENLEIRGLSIKPNGNIVLCNRSGVYERASNNSKWNNLYTGSTKKIYSISDKESYVITMNGIIYTNDNGQNWIDRNNGFHTSELNDLIFLPGKILLCGTEKSGVYRSEDKGLYWKSSNNGITNLWVNKIAINSRGDVFVGSLGCGIFRSKDNGNTWENINNGLRNFNIKDIEIGLNDEVFIGTEEGVYYSSNNGNLWIKVELYVDGFNEKVRDIHLLKEKGLNKLFVGSLDGLVVTNLYTTASIKSFPYSVDLIYSLDEKIFVVAQEDGFTNHQIYRSDDNGKSWSKIFSGYNNMHFWTLSRDNDKNLLAGTNKGLYLSTDLGRSWNIINNGISKYGDEQRSTYSLIKSLLVLEDGGLFLSFDGAGLYYASSWKGNYIPDNNGLPLSNIEDIKGSIDGYFYVGTSANGLFKSTDRLSK